MKYTNKLLTIAALLSLFLTFSCKKNGGDPTPEVPGAKLAGTWAAVQENAISGPTDEIEAKFADFTININPTASQVSYSTSTGGEGDPLVFPTNGTFDVEASDNFETGAEIIRQPDGVPMTATLSNNGQTLTLQFRIDTQNAGTNTGNARVAGIVGDYTFILDKQ